MPVKILVDYEKELSLAEEEQLKNGANTLGKILQNSLLGARNRDYRFIRNSHADGFSKTTNGTTEKELTAAAEHLSCNAVLDVVLERYSTRIGGDYSAQKPASAAFSYRLYDVTHKKVLCHGRYEETQQSLTDNLLTWKKASKRGFTWITAQQLLEEGVQDKFSQCPYLTN